VDWNHCYNVALPYVFSIDTPEGSGSGFFLAHNEDRSNYSYCDRSARCSASGGMEASDQNKELRDPERDVRQCLMDRTVGGQTKGSRDC
jgi:hypothetical protein